MAAKKTAYDVLNSIILEAIESEERFSWSNPILYRSAHNVVSGTEYQGINRFLLNLACVMDGYEYPMFMTFKQAKEKGYQVKKGARVFPVFFSTVKEDKDKHGNVKLDGAGKPKTYWIFRYYRVFNIDDIDMPAEDRASIVKFDVVQVDTAPAAFEEQAEEIVRGYTGPAINHCAVPVACYVPSADEVRIPGKEGFRSVSEYYSTMFHELAHSTGHKDRLDRFKDDVVEHMRKESYAQEELIAEISAAHLCSIAGCIDDTIENSKAYLHNWAARIRDNSRFLPVAFAQAEKAVKMITG